MQLENKPTYTLLDTEFIIEREITDPADITELVNQLTQLYPEQKERFGEALLIAPGFQFVIPKGLPTKIYILWPKEHNVDHHMRDYFKAQPIPSILVPYDNQLVPFQITACNAINGINFLEIFLDYLDYKQINSEFAGNFDQYLATRTSQQSTDSALFQSSAVTPVATAGPILSSIQAMILKDFQNDPDGRPVFDKRFSNDRVIQHFITDSNPDSENLEALAGKAAWQIVERFGIVTAYIHLIFAAYATDSPEPWKDTFTISGTQLINMLGMDRKRSDLTKAEKLKEVAKRVSDLASLGVCIQRWNEGKKDLSVGMGRMWDVWIELKGSPLLPGFADKDASRFDKIELNEFLVTVRPGLWTSKFLNKPGARNGEALRQFGYLAKSTVQFDPYHEELAARLAVYLTVMSKINDTSEYKVNTLLDAVLPADTIATTHTDARKRHDFKKKWDNALVSLEKKGWHITSSFDETPYKNRLPANYWPQFLNSKIGIAPPDPIPALLLAGKEKSSRKPHRKVQPKPTLTGDEIRQAREALKMTQKELAARVGISQPLIARIERGDRKVQPEDQPALQRELGLRK